jgi:cytochrome c553
MKDCHPIREKPFMKHAKIIGCGLLLGLVFGGPAWGDENKAPAVDSAPIEYNRDIRPILADACFRCHGPDSAARKADLRLDQRDRAIETKAIVPGKPDESEIIARLDSTDPEAMMPPPTSHKVVSAEQKELLKRWIAAGAAYQPHWSFIAPVRPAIPAVNLKDWAKNPIDDFILASLEKVGLTPAPPADRRTLARRLSLDLVGLPPDPADVEAFVNDSSANAYEAYVDKLLASEQWGEHRGRYWLDAARYADTHGIHFDNFREIWAYRDWVIGAFNRNMPFDQFTIEQLAGDLLPNRTIDQQIASGFNRCNMTTNEGGVIPEEYLVLYTRDRTETTAQVWMGLTAGCAVCHDHKYDPLSQREFYQLASFFNNTTQGAMDGNIPNTPPIVPVPLPADRERFEKAGVELDAVTKDLEAHVAQCKPAFEKWQAETSPASLLAMVPTANLAFHAPLADGTENQVEVNVAGQTRPIAMNSPVTWEPGYAALKALKTRPETPIEVADVGDFENDQSFSCGMWVKLPADGMTGALLSRMDESSAYRGWDLWVQGNRLGSHVIHSWPGDAIKVVAKKKLEPGIWYHVMLTYDATKKVDGVKLFINGEQQPVDIEARDLKGSIRTAVPMKIAQRNSSARLDGIVIGDVRVYSTQLPPTEIVRLSGATRASYLVGKPVAERSAQESDELFKWWLPAIDTTYQQMSAKSAALSAERSAISSRGTIAHVMQEKGESAMAFILFRGDYDKRRDQVAPKTPDVLPAMRSDLPMNRYGLAQWLLQPEHPLTARVTVNRFWQEVFGTGLVRTTGDFGISGELPSHPALLDWLAVDFRENGWDVKRFYKMLVMSATYQQSAATTPEKREKDPENRWLARGPRFRMDGEMIRDSALASSGLLVKKIGGPSVRPYQPEGVWEAVAMIGSNTRDYRQDTGENLYRRSMYTFWKRAAPPASMEIFNAPNREVCTVRRERTNTPLQALVTLNDPQFVEAARHLAEKAIQEGGDTDEKKLDYVGKRTLSRSFSAAESTILLGSLADLSAHYAKETLDAQKLISFGESKANPSTDPVQLASWTMLVNEIFNLDECLNK